MKFSDAVKKLSDAGIEDAKREARAIFTTLGGYSFADLVGADLKTGNAAVIDAVERRAKREPLQYVIGKVDVDILYGDQDIRRTADLEGGVQTHGLVFDVGYFFVVKLFS